MLGSLRKPDPWQWGATGKHPVARDYISIGFMSPCLRIFSGLVDKGFMKTESTGRQYVSYRYFLKGEKKGMISCGILKDSRDAVGREYPLVIAGYGMLAGWEGRWETVPEAMAAVCSEAEYISSRKLNSLDEFKTGLLRLGAPSVINGRCPAGNPGYKSKISGSGFIPLVPGDEEGISKQVSGYMEGLKESDSSSPEAVFIGGTGEKSCLFVFRKPLDTDNVLRLLTYE
jgi:type VI secretion system protein ImpM